MTQSSLQSGTAYLKSLDGRARLLGGLWLLFLLLVAFGIHGSSTGITAAWWAPEQQYSGYLFNVSRQAKGAGGIDWNGLQTLLMGNAQFSRWDEFAVATPYALSQLSHQPKFPVVNTSIGDGQNMLVLPHTPVLHESTLARPATWGYFVFGAQRGLAWYWWFQTFSCFTVLFLLFEIVLNGHRWLAAFGAFWFCASAYVVCWSNWPAQVTFFAALACLSAYHLLRSENERIQMIASILLGLSIPGFVMFMYPPWQVPLAYLFSLIFIGLLVRDKLHVTARVAMKHRARCLALAAVLAIGLTLSWLITCLPDLNVMSSTVYPGSRVGTGGHYSMAELFRGLYNLITVYSFPQKLVNQSAASSFYYLFPAVLLGVVFSSSLRRRLGLQGWLMIAFILLLLIYLFPGLPSGLSRLTLLSYVPANRADLGLGLASIILSLIVAGVVVEVRGEGTSPLARWIPALSAAGVVVLVLLHGLYLMKFTGEFPPPSFALFISLLMGLLGYTLLAGARKAFCLTLAVLVVATTALFNPLATNLNHVYRSELATRISEINSRYPFEQRPFWVCYGGNHIGALVYILGGRSLTGIQWPPQLALWRAMDPGRVFEEKYNRYAEVLFVPSNDDNEIAFGNPSEGILAVRMSPNNPVLAELGVRYVILADEAQNNVDSSRLSLIYRSEAGNFSIFEIE